jgi:4-amino-4-deoxy-L-arabinose transferase-like glycosyltransferase
VLTLLIPRLSGFGIWDPWELDVADAARRVAQGEAPSEERRLSVLLVAAGFNLLGFQEWSGRLPISVCGLIAVLCAYLMVAGFAGRRAGVYAAIVTVSTPLFLFNSRLMLGDAPAIAFQALVGLGAIAVVFGREGEVGEHSVTRTLGWTLVLAAGLVLSVETRGALLCALPPLAAVSIAALLQGLLLRPGHDRWRTAATLSICALALALLALVAAEVIADHDGYSRWLGGRPGAGQPPAFYSGLKTLFHSFAPLSALLPVALARVLIPGSNLGNAPVEGERGLRLTLILWLFFGYAAQTLFLSRYGSAVAFLPVAAAGACIALFLRDVENDDGGHWSLAIIAVFLTQLIVRDYSIYPSGPVEGIPVRDFEVPESFNLKREWAAIIEPFALFALLGLGVTPAGTRPDPRAPYRLLREQWRRGIPFKIWLSGLTLAVLALVVLGIGATVAPDRLHLSTIAAKWTRRLAVAPVAAPLVILLVQFGFYWFGKLRSYRLTPLIAAAAVFAMVTSHGFLPALSAHFSPREVYETFNDLATDSEELAEYGVGARAATYYARGEVREIKKQAELAAYLAAPERRWVAMQTDDLATIDRTFRKRMRRHLFVADARSARVVLVTNQEIPGIENQSFLVTAVRREPPAPIQYPVKAMFEDKIEFLGYDLRTPGGGHLGAGESFSIIWYFRVLKNIPGNYKMFVHIDGKGLRLNGDHDPVDGKYPVRLWDQGDIIADRQELEVPAHFRRGQYTIFMGFFSGGTRLKVVEGPRDDANRVRSGILRVR